MTDTDDTFQAEAIPLSRRQNRCMPLANEENRSTSPTLAFAASKSAVAQHDPRITPSPNSAYLERNTDSSTPRMSSAVTASTSPSRSATSATRSPRRHIPGEAGLWILIFGDMLVFAVFFATYLNYRSRDTQLFNRSQDALNPSYGVLNTLLLLLSSLLVVTAVNAIRARTQTGAAAPLLRPSITPTMLIGGAIGCGFAFSALKVIEYSREIRAGITPQSNTFYMFYYALTGLHWFHLTVGLAVLVYLLQASRKPALTASQFRWVEGGGCYWHMVDLLWIVLFPLLYLVK